MIGALEGTGLLCDNPTEAFKQAYLKVTQAPRCMHSANRLPWQVNTDIHEAKHIDDSFSGTTAICVLLRGAELWCSCAGDSRAVLATGEALVHATVFPDVCYVHGRRHQWQTDCNQLVFRSKSLEKGQLLFADLYAADCENLCAILCHLRTLHPFQFA